MPTPEDSNTDSTSDANHADHPRDRETVDLSPTAEQKNRYTPTAEGTANPDDVQLDDIRQAVEEARERKREQAEAEAEAEAERASDAANAGASASASASASDDATPPADAPISAEAAERASDKTETETTSDPQPADVPTLADKPDDPDEFFEDELGDPRRDIAEAQQNGLHADSETEPTDTPHKSMTNDTNADDRDERTDTNRSQPSESHETTDRRQPDHARADDTSETARGQSETGGIPRRDPDASANDTPAQEPRGQPENARGESDAPANQRNAGGGRDGGRGSHDDAEHVEPLGDTEIDEVNDAVGADTGTATPDPSDIDFDAQDIEAASEHRGDQLIELNGVYFMLSDVNDERAELLMNALQDEDLDAEGRFDVIIDSVVTKPGDAAARTSSWKYLHRATLAGRCMEHCGLDDIVDFPDEPETTRAPQAGE